MTPNRKDRFFVMAAALCGLLALPTAVRATDTSDRAGGAGATSGSAVKGGSSTDSGAPASDNYSIDTSTPSGGAGSTTGVETSSGSVNDVNDASAGDRAQSGGQSDQNHSGNVQ